MFLLKQKQNNNNFIYIIYNGFIMAQSHYHKLYMVAQSHYHKLYMVSHFLLSIFRSFFVAMVLPQLVNLPSASVYF